jgi:pimeloyl-ACP methyl ester carboxylesterase
MRALAERVPRSTLLTVADAGHAVHDDQRALFVEQLLAFLDEKI